MKIKLTHGTYDGCKLVFEKYQNNRPAIVIQCQDQILCKATVNIPEVPLDQNQILIKNWSENEGILQALIGAEIVKDTGQVVETGFAEANLCDLLLDPLGGGGMI